MIKTYVLSADKLKIDEYSILCDGRTIINLNDEYTNKSYVSREKQIRIINKLLSYQNSAFYGDYYFGWQENFLLHIIMLKLISEYPGKSDTMCFFNKIWLDEFVEYIDQFGEDNIINIISSDEGYDDIEYVQIYMDYIRQQISEGVKYRLIVADADVMQLYGQKYYDSCLNDIKKLLDDRGILIVHKDKKYYAYYIYNDIIYISELGHDMFSKVLNELSEFNNFTDSNIGCIIDDTMQLEEYIIRHRDDEKLYELCYPVNELKTALIDYDISGGLQQSYNDIVRNTDIIEKNFSKMKKKG